MALGLKEAPPGVAAVIEFIGLNVTTEHTDTSINQLATRVKDIGFSLNNSIELASTQSYWLFVKTDPLLSNTAGAVSLTTSRLMGRREPLEIAQNKLNACLQQALPSEDPEARTMLLFRIQRGLGSASAPEYK
ncbi:hypothetical protein PEX1_085970 [Penicillium expansum]|uniref:Uncharacterized protein n=1 Tax=Penicillium expansum TaxID=27334 RepID=A0A0A2J9V6_PENEN|nr:hypothetical protein PEX2_013340 [Penicillium expansum]KGO49125.1 hypothetical protein PEXP_011740 [Penicillium expansum]KGO50043.1 hypothetical protein PEX1_085970 [Penicillium expansum]KGO62121.1 hypothetical protein PEX2_013340 [Penicillium expansum]